MSDSGGVVRDVSWRDLCPWLMLTRTFSLATSMQVLLAALLAVTLTPIGWQIGDRILLQPSENEPTPGPGEKSVSQQRAELAALVLGSGGHAILRPACNGENVVATAMWEGAGCFPAMRPARYRIA